MACSPGLEAQILWTTLACMLIPVIQILAFPLTGIMSVLVCLISMAMDAFMSKSHFPFCILLSAYYILLWFLVYLLGLCSLLRVTGPQAISGFGFELTFRLRREPEETAPPTWPAALMQALARYVFQSGLLTLGKTASALRFDRQRG